MVDSSKQPTHNQPRIFYVLLLVLALIFSTSSSICAISIHHYKSESVHCASKVSVGGGCGACRSLVLGRDKILDESSIFGRQQRRLWVPFFPLGVLLHFLSFPLLSSGENLVLAPWDRRQRHLWCRSLLGAVVSKTFSFALAGDLLFTRGVVVFSFFWYVVF
jgi:hypothetical protein